MSIRRKAARQKSGWPPIVWLALIIFVATIAACLITIMLAMRHPDEPLSPGKEALFGVPSAASPFDQRGGAMLRFIRTV
ncbi:MAG TPA: hypothetical protein VK025_11425 [Steroidobacter sp.]|nr:hypothetical protein [Steroidobacteraceae bacterium]HLS82003.1 hypothetical protein [Steroidobacter sp.]